MCCFFMFGSIGVYNQWDSEFSVWSVVEVCVMSFLMYRLENWILNVTTTTLLHTNMSLERRFD